VTWISRSALLSGQNECGGRGAPVFLRERQGRNRAGGRGQPRGANPTAHAEICAIREATAKLQTEHFIGCELAQPCPMCLAAMYYCGPDRVFFLNTREEYAAFYQDDRKYISFAGFYNEFGLPWNQRRLPMVHQPRPQGIAVYRRRWKELNG
jgi:tRNA(Arg) A34 adenosine deaminase TadA